MNSVKLVLLPGPLALDNVVSEEAARHKGIESSVCGHDGYFGYARFVCRKYFTKALTFFAHLESAGTLNGCDVPAVMTSRTDTEADKYYSILMAVMKGL